MKRCYNEEKLEERKEEEYERNDALNGHKLTEPRTQAIIVMV